MDTVFVVKQKIDNLEPGTVVNSRYDVETLQRLIDEGFIEAKSNKPKSKATFKKLSVEEFVIDEGEDNGSS